MRWQSIIRAASIAAALAVMAHHLPAQGMKETVSLDGSGRASRLGDVRGDEWMDYILRAGKGQQIDVAIRSASRAVRFHVIAPNSDTRMWDGDRDGDEFSATASADGAYTVRVFMSRSAARRDDGASYTIGFRVGGSGRGGVLPPEPQERPRDIDPRVDPRYDRRDDRRDDRRFPNDDRRPSDDRRDPPRSGGADAWPGAYDAEGDLKCSFGDPSLNRYCEYRAQRGDRGVSVFVRSTTGNGPRIRRLYFADNQFDANGQRVEAQRQNDGYWVKVGDEFYLIPYAALRTR